MANQPKLTLKSGVGKASGKPYTLLEVQVGTWKKTHFPTAFEKDYLIKYFEDGGKSFVTLNPDETINLQAGDYEYSLAIESTLERRYVVNYFRSLSSETKSTTEVAENDKINLNEEDDLKPNPFD